MSSNSERIGLGDEVKDLVSGFTGIVISKIVFLNGCVRHCVAARVKDDNSSGEERYFDDEQLQVLRKGAVKPKPALPDPEPAADAHRSTSRAGGDRPDHPRR